MDIEGILASLKGILVQTGDPPTSHYHPQGWEQKTESNSQGLNHLHSLCKDLCKDRAQPRNLPLYLPTPTKFPPKLSNSCPRSFYTPRHRPSRFGLPPPHPRQAQFAICMGFLLLKSLRLARYFHAHLGLSASVAISCFQSVCVPSHLAAQPYRLMAQEHHSAGHFLCEKSEAFCQEKKMMFFGNSTTESHSHSWPTHDIVDSLSEVTRDR